MKITVDDVRFWEAKQPHPKWWHDYKRDLKVSKPIVDFDIDRVVNGHCETKEDPRYAAHEVLAATRKGLKQGRDLLSVLNHLVGTPSAFANHKRGQAYALRWWSRIYQSRMEKQHETKSQVDR